MTVSIDAGLLEKEAETVAGKRGIYEEERHKGKEANANQA